MTQTKTATPTRLSELAPSGGSLTPMEDIKEKDLILLAAEPCETQFGNGYRLTLTEKIGGEEFEVLTSAVVVCKQLDKALEANAFCLPMIVCFTKQGRAWIIQ
jgi:hypothetical protein